MYRAKHQGRDKTRPVLCPRMNPRVRSSASTLDAALRHCAGTHTSEPVYSQGRSSVGAVTGIECPGALAAPDHVSSFPDHIWFSRGGRPLDHPDSYNGALRDPACLQSQSGSRHGCRMFSHAVNLRPAAFVSASLLDESRARQGTGWIRAGSSSR